MLQRLSGIIWLIVALLFASVSARSSATQNWPTWQKYPSTVQAPTGAIKAGDLARARENLQRYVWAQQYLQSLQQQSDS